jgi:hypothetical protein
MGLGFHGMCFIQPEFNKDELSRDISTMELLFRIMATGNNQSTQGTI